RSACLAGAALLTCWRSDCTPWRGCSGAEFGCWPTEIWLRSSLPTPVRWRSWPRQRISLSARVAVGPPPRRQPADARNSALAIRWHHVALAVVVAAFAILATIIAYAELILGIPGGDALI